MDETAFDVIVIGGGLAGCCAALGAREAGASVLLVEKTGSLGGSSILSGGGFAFAGTPLQERQGVHDDGERLKADIVAAGDGKSVPALVDAYIAHQLETYEWLGEQGVEFLSLQVGAGNSLPRVNRTTPAQVLDTLGKRMAETPGIRVLFDASALRLLRNDDARVDRVLISHAGNETMFTARKGIVLASGGFSRSPELLSQFAPDKALAVPLGGEGNTGDGLRMARELGAGLRDMEHIKGTFGSHPDATGASNMILLAFYKGAIIVNARGERFVNETLPYKELGDACLAQPGAIGYQIFDAGIMARSDPTASTYDFKAALAAGRLNQADTLDALAATLGIPAEQLHRTVAAYNEVADGRTEDPHGRRHLPAGQPLARIDTAPYYAYASRIGLLATYAGITIAADSRVLDASGAPIPGLFAAGEVTGGFHGAGYVSGTSLGKAAIFGRMAGRNAATD